MVPEITMQAAKGRKQLQQSYPSVTPRNKTITSKNQTGNLSTREACMGKQESEEQADDPVQHRHSGNTWVPVSHLNTLIFQRSLNFTSTSRAPVCVCSHQTRRAPILFLKKTCEHLGKHTGHKHTVRPYEDTTHVY